MHNTRIIKSVSCAAIAVGFWAVSAVTLHAQYGDPPAASINSGYTVTRFDSDLAGLAKHQDARLVNPWGVVVTNGSLIIADNGTGLITTYGPANGTIVRTSITVPPPAGGQGPAAPDGLVLNPTKSFDIGHLVGHLEHESPATYLISTEDGTVSAWNSASGTNAVLVIDHSTSNAVYKGLAIAATPGGPELFVANFRSNMVEVFDTNFNFLSAFTDPAMGPLGFAPFNIAVFQDKLIVAYAKQDAEHHDDVAGPGNGYIDIFNTDGTLVRSFAAQGALNSPWGLAIAPLHFGKFSQSLLIGNFGDGWINAYNLLTGEYLGPLTDSAGAPLALFGLWGLTFNVEPPSGDLEYIATTLYFAQGLNGENDGIMGSIKPITPMFPAVH